MDIHDKNNFQKTVYEYYQRAGRHDLPWRKTVDPYKIAVSEIMLQQTQVGRVIEKYLLFLEHFPTVNALANAPLSEVLKLWSGLGYNRRAKFLKTMAEHIVSERAGKFPKTKKELEALPGIGSYTAGAIAAFAYNQPEVCIETNIRTVFIYHFFADIEIVSDMSLAPLIEVTLDYENPRQWYWALMDYGSHLKQWGIVTHRKSKHYLKQDSFSGSRREVRGAILRFLINAPATTASLSRQSGKESVLIQSVLADLVSEKMVEKKGQNIISHLIDRSSIPHTMKYMEPEDLSKNITWRDFFNQHPLFTKWLPIVGVSVLSSIGVLMIATIIVWINRVAIADKFFNTQPSAMSNLPLTIEDSLVEEPIDLKSEESKDLSVTEVVAKVNASVVSIEVSQMVVAQVNPFMSLFSGGNVEQSSPQPRIVSRGTGFFASSDGLIITNRHVVDFTNATYSITTSEGKKYTATLIAKDPVFDLAVLKVTGSGFPAAVLGNSDTIELGQSVVAIGFALGQFKNSISVGIISGLSRSIVAGGLGGGATEQLDRVIQTDAAINPGNSGGPLLNLKGEVVGVNVAVAESSQSIAFAIPSNNVKDVLSSVQKTGTIVRPYVGIQYVQITPDIQKKNKLAVDYGVFVQKVMIDSPATIAGIAAGDIILSIDGIKLDGDPSFATVIRGKTVGKNVLMQVLTKAGIQTSITVKLIQAPNS